MVRNSVDATIVRELKKLDAGLVDRWNARAGAAVRREDFVKAGILDARRIGPWRTMIVNDIFAFNR